MIHLSNPISRSDSPGKPGLPAGKFKPSRSLRVAAVLMVAVVPYPVQAITVQFDYSYDTRGFFTDSVSGEPIAERRAILELAASTYARFSDHLMPITPQAGDTWSVTITHPSLGGPPLRLTDLAVAADTIRVYVGGSPSAPGVLGFAGAGNNLSASGSESFVSDVLSRGQLNTSGENASDYGVWGGYIWFNAVQDWYFGVDVGGLSAGRPEF